MCLKTPITDFITTYQLPTYRMRQFVRAYYRQYIESIDELTTWPYELRKKFSKDIPFSRLEVRQLVKSKDCSTIKVVFERLRDGKYIESVLMRHDDGRSTVCVSSMVGCPMGCSFCATGKMGFLGNLQTDEILDQILYFGRFLKTEKRSISNIVFMGMGEPLLNYDEVMGAIGIITDPMHGGMSMRRITISTSGIIPGIKRLIADGFDGRLAISLHSALQSVRDRLMPGAKQYLIKDLMLCADEFVRKTNRRITYEYILIAGVNDAHSDAEQLSDLLKGRLAHVNLIPVNSVEGTKFKKSTRSQQNDFLKILSNNGVAGSIRYAMGEDIQAACGQLIQGKKQSII